MGAHARRVLALAALLALKPFLRLCPHGAGAALAPAVAILFAACEDVYDEPPPQVERYSAYFDALPGTTTGSTVIATGSATCDACPDSQAWYGYCQEILGPFPSGIDIHWNNVGTGETGGTNHQITGRCACLFSTCWTVYEHEFSTKILLAIGSNTLQVAATGPDKAPGYDEVVVVRLPPAPDTIVARAAACSIEVEWSPVAGADSYDLYWSTCSISDLAAAVRVPCARSPWTHTRLDDETTVHYPVVAIDEGWCSLPGAETWATTGWSNEPASGASFAASGREDVSCGSATNFAGFNWQRGGLQGGRALPTRRRRFRVHDRQVDGRDAGRAHARTLHGHGRPSRRFVAPVRAHGGDRRTGLSSLHARGVRPLLTCRLRSAGPCGRAGRHSSRGVVGRRTGPRRVPRERTPRTLGAGASSGLPRLRSSAGAGPLRERMARLVHCRWRSVAGPASGGGWTTSIVDRDVHASSVSLLFDEAGAAHLACMGGAAGPEQRGTLYHAREEEGARERVRVGAAPVGPAALVLDAAGLVEIHWLEGETPMVSRGL